ncbi:MAG: DUF4276 family protein [Ktedonobacteraceae bacterium]|nr:DUF4276 family protein [Ktedonobacteraceae bacterium]
MPKVSFFVEDFGHEAFLEALLRRFEKEYRVSVGDIKRGSVRGGHGKAINELKQYIRYLQKGKEPLPDLIIVAIDGNCKGFLERKKQVDEVVKDLGERVISAIPDPHIERWLLLDSDAFKQVLGKGCTSPTYKCERDLYKKLLDAAVTNAGKESLFGGLEYASLLVPVMNLEYLERTEESLGRLLKALRHKFQEWQRTDPQQPQTPPDTSNPPV